MYVRSFVTVGIYIAEDNEGVFSISFEVRSMYVVMRREVPCPEACLRGHSGDHILDGYIITARHMFYLFPIGLRISSSLILGGTVVQGSDNDLRKTHHMVVCKSAT